MRLSRARVTRHGANLTRISILMTNCYLVREDDGLTLIDCCIPGSAGAILAAAEQVGAPIRRIALTHAHWDHTGSLESLRARLPDGEVMIGAREERLLLGDFEPLPGEPEGSPNRLPYRPRDVRPERLLEPGDRIGSLEVVDAKGHTPGQVGFRDGRDGTVVCGDAYLNVGKPFVTSELVARFPVPALVGTWHAASAVDSARRLRELQPTRLASGHGRVVEAPVAAMDEALVRAET